MTGASFNCSVCGAQAVALEDRAVRRLLIEGGVSSATGVRNMAGSTMASQPVEPPPELLPAPDWPQGRWWNIMGYRSAATRARVMYAVYALALVSYVGVGVYYVLNFDALVETTAAQFRVTQIQSQVALVDPTTLYIGLLSAAVGIAVAVATLAWLSRSVDNSWYLLGGTPQWSPAWSIGWWFIPFANFVMPFLIVNDLNRRMARGIAKPRFGLLLIWWLLGFVIAAVSLVMSVVVGFQAALPPGPTQEQLRTLAWTSILSSFASAIPTLLTLVVYSRIQRFADKRARYALAIPAPAMPYPAPQPPAPLPPAAPAGG